MIRYKASSLSLIVPFVQTAQPPLKKIARRVSHPFPGGRSLCVDRLQKIYYKMCNTLLVASYRQVAFASLVSIAREVGTGMTGDCKGAEWRIPLLNSRKRCRREATRGRLASLWSDRPAVPVFKLPCRHRISPCGCDRRLYMETCQSSRMEQFAKLPGHFAPPWCKSKRLRHFIKTKPRTGLILSPVAGLLSCSEYLFQRGLNHGAA